VGFLFSVEKMAGMTGKIVKVTVDRPLGKLSFTEQFFGSEV